MATHNQTANTISSLPVTLSALKTASGNSAATLYQFRRGGTEILNVANSYSGLSTSSGAITPLAGLKIPPVQLRSSITADDNSFTASPAVATMEIRSTGQVYTDGNQSGTTTTDWLLNGGSQYDWDVKVNPTSKLGVGAAISGTVNTWINLNATRQYQVEVLASPGQELSHTVSGYVALRMNASPQTEISNCTFSLGADSIRS